MKDVEQKETKDYSINLKIDNRGRLILPIRNPIDNKYLEYVNENDVPLIPFKKQLQKTIDFTPIPPEALWKQACTGDAVTVKSWDKVWNKALDDNLKLYNFENLSCFSLYGKEAYKPVILAGSGPSLRNNYKYLKKTYFNQINLANGKVDEVLIGGREDIKIVSCLHNFAFFEDNDVMTKEDYYVNLDAGPITVTELSEGGEHDEDWYWDKTKNRILITTVLANTELLKRWKGKIYFFKTASSTVKDFAKKVNPKKVPIFSVGGNVLGACLYFAKAILGAGPTIFIGADFCFSYDHKFHGWDSQYDAQFQGVIPTVDIYGNRVFTWPSYNNFKCFFDFIATGGVGKNPQMFINATEGGCLGAYPEGNIRHIQQITLKEILYVFTMHTHLPEKMNGKMETVLF